MKTIDATPTWSAITPWLLAILQEATTKKAREAARKEILRMAEVADRHVKYVGTLSAEGSRHE